MKRATNHIPIPSTSIGQRRFLTVHQYGEYTEEKTERIYIQASLHADEIPGMLVLHHLIKLLDKAADENRIKKCILIVPYANPIGLSQQILGSHLGRFNVDTGINFNRNWPDVSAVVGDRIEGRLSESDAQFNVNIIRGELLKAIKLDVGTKEEVVLKRTIFEMAALSDIVLDLHCDSDAVMHLYTHSRLWPNLSDLACDLRSETQIISEVSGGNPFDEACSCLWASLADRFPGFPIPMACAAATIELRGEVQVSDELASMDAAGLMSFLQRRGYIDYASLDVPPIPPLLREATELSAVDMIEAPVAGVVVWRVVPGATVAAGEVLGEIVNIEDPDAARTEVKTSTAGIVFGMRYHRLVRPGQIIIKVSGDAPLSWRKGNLLTAK